MAPLPQDEVGKITFASVYEDFFNGWEFVKLAFQTERAHTKWLRTFACFDFILRLGFQLVGIWATYFSKDYLNGNH